MSVEGAMNSYKYIGAIEGNVIPVMRREFDDDRGKL